jgi:hypothetical protein
VKQPAKQMALPCRSSYIEDGEVKFLSPQEVAYREAMGRPAPEPFPEGTLAHEQWTYHKDSRRRSADELAHPKAKPAKPKPKPRPRRRPVGV